MEPITARYTRGDTEWTVVVSGHGTVLTATAPGIVSARDHADHLAVTITPARQRSTVVVHLLNGSAVEFTRAYLSARLSLAGIDGHRMGQQLSSQPDPVAEVEVQVRPSR